MKIDGKPVQDQWVVMVSTEDGWVVVWMDGFDTRAEAVDHALRYDQPGQRYAVAKIVPSCYIEDGKVRPCD